MARFLELIYDKTELCGLYNYVAYCGIDEITSEVKRVINCLQDALDEEEANPNQKTYDTPEARRFAEMSGEIVTEEILLDEFKSCLHELAIKRACLSVTRDEIVPTLNTLIKMLNYGIDGNIKVCEGCEMPMTSFVRDWNKYNPNEKPITINPAHRCNW